MSTDRVSNEVTSDDLKEYMKTEKVEVIEIQLVSKESRAAKSFRMVVECAGVNPYDVVFNPSFWPEGYCCRRWHPSKKTTN